MALSPDLLEILCCPEDHTPVKVADQDLVARLNAAIAAGKHVHAEKPLAVSVAEGRTLVEAAKARGVRVGSAPDTFLGAGQQTARALIDAGRIGRPVAGTAFMMVPGHERWHPNPDFYYAKGGGPLFDMGPYYLTTLVNMLGPVARVTGTVSAAYAERRIASGPRAGQAVPVGTPIIAIGAEEPAAAAPTPAGPIDTNVPPEGNATLVGYGPKEAALQRRPRRFPSPRRGDPGAGAGVVHPRHRLADGGD